MISKANSKVIHIEDILDFNDIELFLGEGSLSQILPEDGKEDEPRIKSKVYPDYERTTDNEPKGGGHGFDPEYVEEMRAIMYGFGPAFRKNYTSEPLEMVDHYNLFCNLVGIPVNPNNGSEDRVEKLLKEAEDDENSDESDYDSDDDDKDDSDGDG
ncbi:unnamed protein product [Oppiella nova]|uniref:Uncharacterized protein n=1 Tax=Oppiella nova TaxID=334625 RepID=A0A7R9QWN6_9ACAR|nr:unnamed protein product [Oppiella nova]CAG2177133.1 unnamed protein product [Oppiella nova]